MDGGRGGASAETSLNACSSAKGSRRDPPRRPKSPGEYECVTKKKGGFLLYLTLFLQKYFEPNVELLAAFNLAVEFDDDLGLLRPPSGRTTASGGLDWTSVGKSSF